MMFVNVKYNFYIEPSEYPQEYVALMEEFAYDNEIYELFPCSEYHIEEVIEKISVSSDVFKDILLIGQELSYKIIAKYDLPEVKWYYTILDFTTFKRE